jgi:hypothetical protein
MTPGFPVSTARHEAAHAVVAWAVGFNVAGIFLYSEFQHLVRPTEGGRAFTLIEIPQDPGAWREDAMVMLAGPEIVLMVSHRSRDEVCDGGCESDFQSAAVTISRAFHRENVIAFRMFERCRQETRRLLRAFRPAIDDLTRRLTGRIELNGEMAFTVATNACPELFDVHSRARRGWMPARTGQLTLPVNPRPIRGQLSLADAPAWR